MPTAAHDEYITTEFATPLSHDEDCIDVQYDGESLWYHTMADILDEQPVPANVPHDLEAKLHIAYDNGEPRSFAEAERHAACRAAMKMEMDAVEKYWTWEMVDFPPAHYAITQKWVYKLKKDEAGAVLKHKARLMACRFVQQEGVDFDDAFALEGWRVHHVKSAFLNGDFKEEVYVQQPLGFVIPGTEGKVLRPRKTLYGLRHAPRA